MSARNIESKKHSINKITQWPVTIPIDMLCNTTGTNVSNQFVVSRTASHKLLQGRAAS